MNIDNAAKYNHKIQIVEETLGKDTDGFPVVLSSRVVLSPWAEIKTTKGFTLITNGSDFEKAFTRFTIRYPAETVITYDMLIKFRGKTYKIEYINNVNEAYEELELQCKEVAKIGKV